MIKLKFEKQIKIGDSISVFNSLAATGLFRIPAGKENDNAKIAVMDGETILTKKGLKLKDVYG